MGGVVKVRGDVGGVKKYGGRCGRMHGVNGEKCAGVREEVRVEVWRVWGKVRGDVGV